MFFRKLLCALSVRQLFFYNLPLPQQLNSIIKVHHYKCVHSPSICIHSYALIPVMSSSDALVKIIVLDTAGDLCRQHSKIQGSIRATYACTCIASFPDPTMLLLWYLYSVPLVASAIVPALGVVHQDAEEDNSKVYVCMLYIPGKLYLDMELRKPIKKFDQPVPEKVTPSF